MYVQQCGSNQTYVRTFYYHWPWDFTNLSSFWSISRKTEVKAKNESHCRPNYVEKKPAIATNLRHEMCMKSMRHSSWQSHNCHWLQLHCLGINDNHFRNTETVSTVIIRPWLLVACIQQTLQNEEIITNSADQSTELFFQAMKIDCSYLHLNTKSHSY